MKEQSRPLLGVIFGVLIIAAVGGLFFYGQKQRMTEEKDAQKTAAEEKKAKDVIVIGGIVPLSGEHSAEGLALQKIGDLAVQKINVAGGINKRPIEMVWEDGHCNSADAAAAAQKLVTLKEAKYIIAGWRGCEEEFPSVLSVTEQRGALVMSPLVSHAKLGLKEPGLFLSLFDTRDARFGEAAATYAVTKLGAKKAAVIYDDVATPSENLRTAFKESLLEQGGELVIDLALADMTSDRSVTKDAIKNQLPKLIADIKKSGATVIYLVTADMSSYITEQFSKANLEIPIIGTEVWDTSPKNVIALTIAINVDTNPSVDISRDPVSETGTYRILYLLKDALTAVGNNPEKVRNFLLNIRDWHLPQGQDTLNFSKNGDRAVEFEIWQSENGKAKQTGTYSLED